MNRTILLGMLVVAMVCCVAAYDGYAFYYNAGPDGGIRKLDLATGQSEMLYEGGGQGAVLSSDGRFIASRINDRLWTMDNDGSDMQEHRGAGVFRPGRNQFSWTPGGIFWEQKPRILKYDPETQVLDTMLEIEGNDYPGKGYWSSADGLRAWAYLEIVPKNNPDRNGHGDMAYITYDANFEYESHNEFPGVGYGHCLTADGQFLVTGWTNTNITLRNFADGGEHDVFSSGLPGGINSRNGIIQVINDNDHLMMRCSEGDDYYMVNWVLRDTPEALPEPNEMRGVASTAWAGTLPDPDAPVAGAPRTPGRNRAAQTPGPMHRPRYSVDGRRLQATLGSSPRVVVEQISTGHSRVLLR